MNVLTGEGGPPNGDSLVCKSMGEANGGLLPPLKIIILTIFVENVLKW